jgi:hypothetical protein
VDDNIPWRLFRETYIGVAPEPAADFDWIIYDKFYKSDLFKTGLCYGMDVTALLMMKNGGHLGFCHPPYTYDGLIFQRTPGVTPSDDRTGPIDPNLKTAIEITHGNQINHGFISFLIDNVAINKVRDGKFAFERARYYLEQNDPPIICMNKAATGIKGEDGHVMIPYYCCDTIVNLIHEQRIYVYDPNNSFYRSGDEGVNYYKNKKNFFRIGEDNSWYYDSEHYGSPSSGGRIIVVPLSIAGKKDRLPQSLVADGLLAIQSIIVFGNNVKVEQISDPINGRCLFNTKGNDIETDESKRMNNILPFIPFNSFESHSVPKSVAYFYRGKNPLKIQIRAQGNYTVVMMFNGLYKEIKAIGNGSIQHFTTPDFRKKVKQSMKIGLPNSKFKFNQLN